MHIRFTTRLTLLLALLGPMPAVAQGTYVSASVIGDIMRFSGPRGESGPDLSGSGEAIGFALRLGTPIGSIWGVEAELARSSEIRAEGDFATLPYSALVFTGPVSRIDTFSLSTFPVTYSYSLETQQRLTSFSTSAWVRQELSQKVSLVYVGGLAFTRTAREAELTSVTSGGGFLVSGGGVISIPTPVISRQTTQSVAYGAHPVAGVEARIALTEHVEIVPGIRLMGLGSGWLVRPAVGISWAF